MVWSLFPSWLWFITILSSLIHFITFFPVSKKEWYLNSCMKWSLINPVRTRSRIIVFPDCSYPGCTQIVIFQKFYLGQNVMSGGIKQQQKLSAWFQNPYQLISLIVEMPIFGKIIKLWSTNGSHTSINPILTLTLFHQSLTHHINLKMHRNIGCKYSNTIGNYFSALDLFKGQALKSFQSPSLAVGGNWNW